MDVTTVLQVAKEALYVAALVSAPSLLTVLAVGLLIGLLQAATQIQEMTLAFIPKLIALVAAIIIAGAWMLGILIDFTQQLFADIPGLIG
jgi:flagellar biosynthetic protein FliQ